MAKRRSVDPKYSMCVQPSFIIGTNNEDVPVLNESRWVYECEVARTVETGDSTTFFCHIRNIQMDERLTCEDIFDIDFTVLDPVIYSGKYHSIGKTLGKIGDFVQ